MAKYESESLAEFGEFLLNVFKTLYFAQTYQIKHERKKNHGKLQIMIVTIVQNRFFFFIIIVFAFVFVSILISASSFAPTVIYKGSKKNNNLLNSLPLRG